MYTVVAFYTRDTPYENIIKTLETSLQKFNVGYYFKGYEDRGEWVRNCAIKPEFLKHALMRCGDILYVDADATFERAPEDIFDGVFYYYRFRGKEALSGTLFIKKCPYMFQFLDEWIELQKQHPRVYDQEVMDRVIKRHPNWGFRELPKEYIKIFDLMRRVENPVIVHHQASRKYKDSQEEKLMGEGFVLPKKVRILSDGTYALIRRHKPTEDYMDKHLKRFGRLRWYPEMPHSDTSVFKDLFKGKYANIIGKGPSLDYLSKDDINNDGPVICLNESIHVVEKLGLENPLFVIQQDPHLKDTCVPNKITTKMLVSFLSQACGRGFENRFIFKPVDLGMRDTSLTAQLAIGFCKIFGIDKIRFLCFDACVNEDCRYAKAIGYEPSRNGNPKRFLRHRKILDDMSKRFNPEWIIPQDTSSSSDDSTQTQ